ncbi:MAG: carboxypeptidase-like regulatory domain-containing protein, partial [Anaerolineae bacterium]|nr:carboxypeptidase-like regulatory domain-containing protein [Anaerolineae bacterium]
SPTAPQTDPNAIATAVAATLQSSGELPSNTENSSQPVAATATVMATLTSTISGKVCFPSEVIPAMTLYLNNTLTNSVVEVSIAQNQSSYQTEVPAGTYLAYAWLPEFSIGGSYSHAVPCGLDASCTNHTPLSFVVGAGENATGIDVCDWYGGPFDVPYPPGFDPASTLGAISGTLGYPSEAIPALRIVAFNLDSGYWYYVNTNRGASSYVIDDLPPGNYHVVAYTLAAGLSGGYTQYVLCGLSVNCSDHSLITVVVTGGQTTENINPIDWYAPQGSFPANPSP